jgi:hypothetical protein
MFKRLKILLLIIFSQSMNAMTVDSNLLEITNSVNTTSIVKKVIVDTSVLGIPGSKLEIIQPIKTLSDQIFCTAKNLVPSSMVSLFSAINNPYILLITSEALAFTYILCVNSCDHNTSLVQSFFSPESIAKFIQSSAPFLIDGLAYASGEALYQNFNRTVQKIVGPTAFGLISLNFVCQDCFDAKLPTAAKGLLTAVATPSSLNLIQNKIEEKKESLSSIIKNPIVIGTAIVAGVATCTYIYNSFESQDFSSLIPSIVTVIKQSLLYNCAYKISKGFLQSLKMKIGPYISVKP